MKTIVGDEWVTIADGNGPWSDKLLKSMRECLFGRAVKSAIDDPEAPILQEYLDYCRRGHGYNDANIEFEKNRLRELCANLPKNYDSRAGMLLDVHEDRRRTVRSGPMSLNILADGSFDMSYIPDGNHRMTSLAIAGMPFNVLIADRAPEWEQLKQSLYGIWGRKYIYQPIPHPDFDSWEVGHGGNERFAAIEEYVRVNDCGGNVLDCGCNYGYLLYYLLVNGTIESADAFDFAALAHKIASMVLSPYGVSPALSDAIAFFANGNDRYSTIFAMSLVYHFVEIYPIEKSTQLIKVIIERCEHFIFDDAPTKDTWPEAVKSGGLVKWVEKVACRKSIKIGHDTEFNRGIFAIGGDS